MRVNRRRALSSCAALIVSAWGDIRLAGAADNQAIQALENSPLIYLSPIVSNGHESSCHAEVWFVYREGEIFVVTWSEKWKAEAMRRGFTHARIWIGDFGPWQRAEKRYLSAPSLEIEGKFESDPEIHAGLLNDFANKYKTEWRVWDGQVRDGLSNGGWVLLRYQIVS